MILFAWNPINFLDGEGPWFMWEILLLLGALIFSKFVGVLFQYIVRKTENPLMKILFSSLYSPVISIIWYFVLLYSFELVTHQFLSDAYPRIYSAMITLGVTFLVGWFLLRLKNRFISHLIQRSSEWRSKGLDATGLSILSKLLTVLIGAIVFVMLNDVFGIQLTTMLAIGGVGGLALAFASQEIIANFFGGLMIHVTRPFVLEEYVAIPSHNIEGTIEEIGWYQTRVRELSKTPIYIPNSLFSKTYLVNKSRMTHRMVDSTFFVHIEPYETALSLVADIEEYVETEPRFDQFQWHAIWIESVQGSVCQLRIMVLARTAVAVEFYRFRNEVFLHILELIEARGGKLLIEPQSVAWRGGVTVSS